MDIESIRFLTACKVLQLGDELYNAALNLLEKDPNMKPIRALREIWTNDQFGKGRALKAAEREFDEDWLEPLTILLND